MPVETKPCKCWQPTRDDVIEFWFGVKVVLERCEVCGRTQSREVFRDNPEYATLTAEYWEEKFPMCSNNGFKESPQSQSSRIRNHLRRSDQLFHMAGHFAINLALFLALIAFLIEFVARVVNEAKSKLL